MQYNKNRIEVTEGQTIQLTLKHGGQLPKEAMGHNWVLLKQGTDMVDFATKAIAAKDSDYIPAGSEASIIANTKMIGGGESTNIEFTAPGPGEYDFLCTFPGHYAMMKGKFVVKAK
ncbi:UNVERIFIED_CONTAM: hypothetical protein GTU68_006129 [Idotea baltica]|nr:hypothetical protein [Idotea baltica]